MKVRASRRVSLLIFLKRKRRILLCTLTSFNGADYSIQWIQLNKIIGGGWGREGGGEGGGVPGS